MADEKNTTFSYLLNVMENAASEKHPAKAGYAGKRKALIAHVRELECKAAMVDQLAPVLAFLAGEAPLDGVWFGDPHPTEKGTFWWRKHLRPDGVAPTPAPAEIIGWQWRRTGQQWPEKLLHGEPALTAPDTEKRAIYAGPTVTHGVGGKTE